MIKTYLFSKDGVREDVSIDEHLSMPQEDCRLLWVDVRQCGREDMEHLAQRFGLHSVAVEGTLDPYRRPHLYEFADHFYVNLTILGSTRSNSVRPAELHLFAGAGFVITAVRGKTSEATDKALAYYSETPGACSKGSMFATYLLAEYLVESYVPTVERLDREADKLEEMMLERPEKDAVRKLFALKSKVFELRRLLGPQRDILSELARRDFPFLEGESHVYYQDVYNRTIRIFDMLDNIREILSSCLDIYLSTVSNRLNEVMKVLTVLATVLGVLTFIASFYGMNFTHLPWLDSPNAFRNVSLTMIVCAVVMLILFKWKRWL